MFFIVANQMREEVDAIYRENDVCYIATQEVNGEKMCKVFMERIPIIRTEDMLQCIMGLLAGFYVFHIEYPRKLARTLTFYQTDILGIASKTIKDPVMLQFAAKLQKH